MGVKAHTINTTMNYRIINRVSGNEQVLNQEQYDRFFDNNKPTDFIVHDNDIINNNQTRATIGYFFIASAIVITIVINIIEINQ